MTRKEAVEELKTLLIPRDGKQDRLADAYDMAVREMEQNEHRPLIRANWIFKKGFNVRPYECDLCHNSNERRSNYCPCCGAYMTEEATQQ